MVRARSSYKTLNVDMSMIVKKQINLLIKMSNYTEICLKLSHVKPASIPLSRFGEYFKSVNNPSDPFYTPDEDVMNFNERYVDEEFGIMFDELNVEFSEEEILKSIKQLKTNKSSCPDRLINECFINGKNVLFSILLSLFNKIFENGTFPKRLV